MRNALLLVVGLALAAPVLSQPYPSRPVKLIVPDAPGSAPDIRARQIAPRLGEALGQPIVVDNRPGGSMIIGAEAAAKSAPDGYTVFMGNVVTHSLNPLLFKSLPYRADEDFIPVTLVSAGPLILLANPQLGVSRLEELIALGKAKPGAIHYGYIGRGSISHVAMEQINALRGARFEGVAYKATAQYVQDLLAGHIMVALNYWSVVGGHVRAGRLKAIAVAAPQRLEVAPEIPTFSEEGLGAIEGFGWQGLFVPAGTPAAIVERLHREAARAFQLPEIRTPIIETGAIAGGNSREEFSSFVQTDRARWKRAIADTGLVLEPPQ